MTAWDGAHFCVGYEVLPQKLLPGPKNRCRHGDAYALRLQLELIAARRCQLVPACAVAPRSEDVLDAEVPCRPEHGTTEARRGRSSSPT